MKALLSAVLIFCLLQIIAAVPYFQEKDMMLKRGVEENPDWNALGWAWGKRSAPVNQIPRRFLRAVHAVKKNPDWHDLGWTWGRK